VKQPDAGIATAATFTVRAGRPGIEQIGTVPL